MSIIIPHCRKFHHLALDKWQATLVNNTRFGVTSNVKAAFQAEIGVGQGVVEAEDVGVGVVGLGVDEVEGVKYCPKSNFWWFQHVSLLSNNRHSVKIVPSLT